MHAKLEEMKSHLDSLDFRDSSSYHGKDRDEDADANPLEHCNAADITREVADNWNEDTVVQGDQGDDGDGY